MTPDFHQERYVSIIKKNLASLNHLAALITPEQARTLRDGGTGWTVLEVLGHLRDFDPIFLARAQSLLDGSHPVFVARDHEQMALEGRYNEQALDDVLAALNVSRHDMIALFESLTPEQLALTGTHPEMGEWTMMRSVAQVAFHDANHIEQILKIVIIR